MHAEGIEPPYLEWKSEIIAIRSYVLYIFIFNIFKFKRVKVSILLPQSYEPCALPMR